MSWLGYGSALLVGFAAGGLFLWWVLKDATLPPRW